MNSKLVQMLVSSRRVLTDAYSILIPLQEFDPFVLVIIDGDGMIFDNYLLRLGEEGGRQAANLLTKAVAAWLRANVGDCPADCRIVTRIYANVK